MSAIYEATVSGSAGSYLNPHKTCEGNELHVDSQLWVYAMATTC